MAPHTIRHEENVKTINCVRHVSVQTGEEFSPEFLRERKPRLDPTTEESYEIPENKNKGFPLEVEKTAYPSADCSSVPGNLTFLCSFGGKILPRPRDGKLRYVGGDTRIISISKKNLTYRKLTKKTLSIFNRPHLIKYQLPEEDLGALISVTCDDDFHHMLDEYHELEKNSQRLRVFLSSLNDPDSPLYDSSSYEYLVAVNGIPQLSFSNLDRGNMVFSPIDNVAGPPGDLLTSDVQSAPAGMPGQLTEVTDTNRVDFKHHWEEDMIKWTETNELTGHLGAENDYVLSSDFNENKNVVECLNSDILTNISTDVSLVESFKDNLTDNSLSLTSDDKNVDEVTELTELVENITDILPPCIPLATIAVPYVQEVSSMTAAQSDNEDVAYDKRVNEEFVSGTAIVEVEAGFHGLQIIKNADLEELRELGSGTFGTVYHGKWRGTDVAIKRIRKSCFKGKSSEQERLTKDFWREALMLSNLHHPNVVALYGVVPDGPGGTLSTVTEYMTNGSLRHVLLKNNSALDWRKKLIIAQDAAIGMEYLHLKKIIHFDLKCENLLVSLGDPQRPICKVGDFGLSRIKRNTFVSGGVRGTLPWMAPELLNGSSTLVSEKVDVFSFGIVMWEILTEEEPYADMHCGAIIENCDGKWKDLMEECWSHDPAERPIFTVITNKLQALLMSKRNNNAKEDMLQV